MESEDHEAGLLVGLAGLRDQGLLLDTCLWAEGEKYQVRIILTQLRTKISQKVVQTKEQAWFIGSNNRKQHNLHF